jgi:hypothetical protein
MFETIEFRIRVKRTVRATASQLGIPEFEPRIVDYLWELAAKNEDILTERNRQEWFSGRGVPNAIVSVRIVTSFAATYALWMIGRSSGWVT